MVNLSLGEGRYWSRYEICSWFETDQSQMFAVMCVLWVLPSHLNPRVSLLNRLGLHLGL